jgi:hypothetical protein
MGFIVPVEVKPCVDASKGCGVFALEGAAPGVRLWESSLVTRRTAREAAAFLATLPREEASTLLRQSFVTAEDDTRLCSNPDDDGRFMNHSPTPNCKAGLTGGAALTTIAPGDELTCDYATLASPPWYEALCAHYGCMSTREVVSVAARAAAGSGPQATR